MQLISNFQCSQAWRSAHSRWLLPNSLISFSSQNIQINTFLTQYKICPQTEIYSINFISFVKNFAINSSQIELNCKAGVK